jgi:hypothetical protein
VVDFLGVPGDGTLEGFVHLQLEQLELLGVDHDHQRWHSRARKSYSFWQLVCGPRNNFLGDFTEAV